VSDSTQSWLQDATLVSPSSETQTVSDAMVVAQVASHRRHDIAFMIQNNECKPYGCLHDSDFWTDHAGPETSSYDASALKTFFELLGGDLKAVSPALVDGSYHRDLGEWRAKDGAKISITEFRNVVDERIVELKVSKLKLWQYEDSRPDFDEARAFRNLTSEQRVEQFRE
jgi:hypothetical protein